MGLWLWALSQEVAKSNGKEQVEQNHSPAKDIKRAGEDGHQCHHNANGVIDTQAENNRSP